jgi:hypothetical protein
MQPDSTTRIKPSARGRDSIRISSKASYDESIIILDLQVRLPFVHREYKLQPFLAHALGLCYLACFLVVQRKGTMAAWRYERLKYCSAYVEQSPIGEIDIIEVLLL